MTRIELLPQIFSLSPDDQLTIAEAIRNHLVGRIAPIEEGEFKAELRCLSAEADEHPADGTPLDVVMERIRKSR
jgi:putative addiction module component (TIGR02574 family)